MRNEIQAYNFHGNVIRTITDISGEPWFVAKDVAIVLGYRDAFNMVRYLNDDDKGTLIGSTLGGKQGMTAINESGLYTAILHSRKPEAKEFKRWVTSEVLPSIRKHGGYIQGQEEMADDELMARALLMVQSKIEEKQAVIEEKESLIEAQRDKLMSVAPKVEFFEECMETHNSMPIEDVAKTMGVSGTTLWRWLRDDRILFKRRDKKHAIQKYLDAGWFVEQIFVVKGKSYTQVRVTPYGSFKIQQKYGTDKSWARPYQHNPLENQADTRGGTTQERRSANIRRQKLMSQFKTAGKTLQ